MGHYTINRSTNPWLYMALELVEPSYTFWERRGVVSGLESSPTGSLCLLRELGCFLVMIASSPLGVTLIFCTCWRHTCTASWTLTKYHCLPMRSKTPDLAKEWRTSWFGLAMAICKMMILQETNSYLLFNALEKI